METSLLEENWLVSLVWDNILFDFPTWRMVFILLGWNQHLAIIPDFLQWLVDTWFFWYIEKDRSDL